MPISIYLAGNIVKNHEKESALVWTSEHQQKLSQALAPIDLHFLNPAERSDDLSDQKSVFGRDLTQVFLADVTLVDVRERRGLGVGAEMMWSKMNGRVVIGWAPENRAFRRTRQKLDAPFCGVVV
jgi:hypothetical protein